MSFNMIHLSVNINKIATLRNSRGSDIPNLVEYARLILDEGAHGLTIHPRSDERHINSSDIISIKLLLDGYNEASPTRKEFNIEGEPSKRLVDIVTSVLPDQVTLVPVTPGEITSDHGFVFNRDAKELEPIIKKIKDQNMRVSLFVDPGVSDLQIAKELGADRIELYTGPFAFSCDQSESEGLKLFHQYEKTALEALNAGLEMNAGHDLDFLNLKIFRDLPGLKEVSIGHRLISWSLKEGLPQTIQRYLAVLG